MTQVLLLGHTSFVGTGIEELFNRNGLEVTTFRRGPVDVNGHNITGSVLALTSNPHLKKHFDVVVNLVVLKDESLEANIGFARELACFVEAQQIPHLIHVSSISSYSDNTSLIVENSPIETNAKNKGSYGSLKVASDLVLLERAKGRFALTLVRPGFVLASGVASPIVGMGARVPCNGLIVLGAGANTVPIVRRTDVQEAIVRVILRGPHDAPQTVLLTDKNSPSRLEYLRWCGQELGVSNWTFALPSWAWLFAGAAGKAVTSLLPGSIDPWRIGRSLARSRRFDATQTETLLGLDIAVDWKSELRLAMAGQKTNVTTPVIAPKHHGRQKGRICIIGVGGIVKQKHLPSLKKLKFDGTIEGYDVSERATCDGVTVRRLPTERLENATLTIVASPGPAHADAIPLLPLDHSSILIEKPLCMSEKELDVWAHFAKGRSGFTGVIHNYRFKSNVQRLLRLIRDRKPGRLLHAHVCFQSPPVSYDIGWRRAERKARTLLMDYGLHFLDIGAMFHTDAWHPRGIRSTVNYNGETDFISGALHSAAYDVSFVLRQGFMPREATVRFIFQNFSATLSFFPDVMSVEMSGDDFGVALQRSGALLGGLASKIHDKLTLGDKDISHMTVLDLAMAEADCLKDLSIQNLSGFYRGIFSLGDIVYEGHEHQS